MNKNKQKLIRMTVIIPVLLITISLSYAYFSANLTGGEESTTITVTGGTMNIIYNGGANINVANIIPSDNPVVIKTFTVTGNNTTDIEMSYQINLIVEENTFSEEALKYKLISTNTDNNGEVAPSINELTNIGTGSKIIELGLGEFDSPTGGNKVHNYNLEIYFPNAEYNQNIDQGKEFKARVSVENTNNLGYDTEKGVNRPVLFTGMTPIKWDNESNEIETNKNDLEWYDYNNKRWANAKTADGSYWVWIPRYAYKILSGYHSDTTGTIDVKFLKGTTNETTDEIQIETSGYQSEIKDTSMYYFLHPAFEFNEGELGFWVAKYEPTAAEGVSTITGNCDINDNVTTKTVKIIPNATSWRCISISTSFEVSQNMKNKTDVYGWSLSEVDSHLIRNVDWGAVAYLSKSKYGVENEEVWNNSYDQYMTGCSGNGVDEANESTCVTYDTLNGQKASTTHNITGVYDMSGGAWDQTASYINNEQINSTIHAENMINASEKYKNVYIIGTTDTRQNNYVANIEKYGDGIYETSLEGNSDSGSWYGDYAYMAYASSYWVARGGSWHYGTSSGIFSFASYGLPHLRDTFRPVVRSAL